MPCLNEAETLEICIRKAQGWLSAARCNGEVIVADNGSTDGSVQIAERCGATVVHVPMRGYGAALYHGSRAARGQFVIMGDSDDSYDFSDLSLFVNGLRGGCDLVMGNRFRGGIMPGAMPWKNRHIGNPILSGIGRLLFGSPAADFHCGLRGFTKDAFERMDLRTTGMEFASEMVIKATLRKLKIAEVPVTLSKDGRSRPPHLKPWRDGWRHLRFMLLFSPRWLFLYPGIALVVVGLLLGGVLLRGPVQLLPNITFDVHTFLMAAMFIIVGLQSISFAIIGRRFASRYGFIPRSEKFDRALESLTLERILLVAIILMLAGAGSLFWGLEQWAARNFGALNTSRTLRAPCSFGATPGTSLA